jgi:predicted nucleic acid-binding protein
MPNGVLLDAGVLVDCLRGRKEAVAYFEKETGPFILSAITVAERYAGIRGSREHRVMEQFILAFEVVPVDDEIARRGGLYRRDYSTSRGVGLADALMAATAQIKQSRLVSLNDRHFTMCKVHVPCRKS